MKHHEDEEAEASHDEGKLAEEQLLSLSEDSSDHDAHVSKETRSTRLAGVSDTKQGAGKKQRRGKGSGKRGGASTDDEIGRGLQFHSSTLDSQRRYPFGMKFKL